MAVTRTYEATIYIECCRDGVISYIPEPIIVSGDITRDRFDTSLPVWRDEVEGRLDNVYRPQAEEECLSVGTRKLCSFYIDIKVDEFGVPETTVPRDVQLRIERLEEMIAEELDIDARMALQEELDRLKARYGVE